MPALGLFGAVASVEGPAAACDLPPLVLIPPGTPAITSAAESDGITSATQAYYDSMVAYVQCVQAELRAAGGDDAPLLVKQVLVDRSNYAVAEVQAVVGLFKKRMGEPGARPFREFRPFPHQMLPPDPASGRHPPPPFDVSQ